jgi:methionine-rich copper-binding protein CopC
MKPVTRTVLLAALAAGLLQSTARAHAFLDRASPRVGSEVSKPPTEVHLWLTQEIEPAFSAIQVFDADGRQIDNKDSHVDSGNKAELIVSLQRIGPGTYKVVWHVVSIDTHRTNGDFKFTVKP